MKRNIIFCFVSLFLTVLVASTLGAHYATSVVKTDMSDPLQVVIARKFLMEAAKGNIIDLNKKLKGGDIKGAALNGENLAVIATVMPPFFKETLKSVYPVKDSKTFFKGADAASFEKASEAMRAAAMDVKNASETGSAEGLKKAVGALGKSCGGCHSAYRGKY